ncbi:hypothetical protein [Spirosoma fluminis]
MSTYLVTNRELLSYGKPKLEKWDLFWVLLLLCIYQGQIQYFQPKGFNIVKITIASALIIAFFLIIRIIKKRLRKNTTFSFFINLYLIIYLFYSLITVFRCFKVDVQVIANLLGNYSTGIGLLVPLMVFIGDKIKNHDILIRTGLKLTLIGIFLTPLGLINGRMGFFASPFVQVSYLLIPFWPYINKKQKLIVVLGLIACLLTGLFTDVRSVILREVLIVSIYTLYTTLRQKSVISYLTTIIASLTILTLVMYADDIVSLYGQREINVFGVKIDNDQNRAWMYEEVITDLKKGNDIFFGRGALGKYFSSFFYSVYQQQGESADEYNRYNIEVGLLAYLLKGGVVLLCSTLLLLLSASFMAFYKSKNLLIKGFGIIILCHTLVMIVENHPKLGVYDVIVWFFVGSCLSKTMRASFNPFLSLNPRNVVSSIEPHVPS